MELLEVIAFIYPLLPKRKQFNPICSQKSTASLDFMSSSKFFLKIPWAGGASTPSAPPLPPPLIHTLISSCYVGTFNAKIVLVYHIYLLQS